MKRFFVFMLLSCAAVFSSKAQSVESLGTAARLSYEWLAQEGYRPTIDEDNDVTFKAEGYYFYIYNDSDSEYLRILLPNIKFVDDDSLDEYLSALLACNEISYNKKLVKAYIDDDNYVDLSISTYIDDTPLVGEFLDTAIYFLISACESWRDSFDSNYTAFQSL